MRLRARVVTGQGRGRRCDGPHLQRREAEREGEGEGERGCVSVGVRVVTCLQHREAECERPAGRTTEDEIHRAKEPLVAMRERLERPRRAGRRLASH